MTLPRTQAGPRTGIWRIVDVLAGLVGCAFAVARELVKLFEAGRERNIEGIAVYVARYRWDVTHGMAPHRVLRAFVHWEALSEVKQRAEEYAQAMIEMPRVPKAAVDAVRSSLTIDELELVYEPYRPGGLSQDADAARADGLDRAASAILGGKGGTVSMTQLVDPEFSTRENVEAVRTGIRNIIADEVWNFDSVRRCVHDMANEDKFAVHSSRDEPTADVEEKYSVYYKRRDLNTGNIEAYHVLAMDRGQKKGALKVEVRVPDNFGDEFHIRVNGAIKRDRIRNHNDLVQAAVKESWNRFAVPFIQRFVWSKLLTKAKEDALEIFADNLRCQLRMPPLRREIVLGIDPGYGNGCKMAVVDKQGQLLSTDLMFPFDKADRAEEAIRILLRNIRNKNWKVTTIVIGNGTASGKTHQFVDEILDENDLGDTIKLTINSESGSSWYSVTTVAQEEFPKLHVTYISAINIARRVQDPLSELVKVEPSHLGLGCYQHGMVKEHLETMRDLVVRECVSDLGVDVNAASRHLLRNVAGLDGEIADSIIKWRTEVGPFRSRDELKQVPGMTSEKFTHTAGFLRIYDDNPNEGDTHSPCTFNHIRRNHHCISCRSKAVRSGVKVENRLDSTMIHPDDYSLARNILNLHKLEVNDVGTQKCVAIFSDETRCREVLVKFKNGRAKQVVEALAEPIGHDSRRAFVAERFRQTVPETIAEGMTCRGDVSNVALFGTFVDLYTDSDQHAMIPRKVMDEFQKKNGGRRLKVGDYVEVEVVSVSSNGRTSVKPLRVFTN